MVQREVSSEGNKWQHHLSCTTGNHQWLLHGTKPRGSKLLNSIGTNFYGNVV